MQVIVMIRSMIGRRAGMSALMLGFVVALIGCQGRTQMLPNSHPALNRPPAQLAADAAKRFPFNTDLQPAGDALAGAEVDYTFDWLSIRNLSPDEWTNVEIWVNRSYVVALPDIKPDRLIQINFRQLFNENGEHFPLDNREVRIESLELTRDGRLYSVPLRLPPN
jgi:hypothetical protein